MSGSKNVLVTGADGGLGLPVVENLLSAGWHVWAFLHRTEKQEAFRKKINREALENLSFITGDVTLAEDVEQAVMEVEAPAALVHLAGGFVGAASLAEQDETIFDKMFNLNTRSAFLLLRTILPVMKKNKNGSIVTIGAKPAVHPGADNAVYAASKAALINLTLSAAEEGRLYDVRANVVVPAVIRTQSNLKWSPSEKEARKWTSPEDMAGVIRWLISEESKNVTGTVIPMYHHIRP